MQIKSTTSIQQSNAIQFKPQNRSEGITADPNRLAVDHLEISAEARALQANSGVRSEKVAELRQQIATGRYETAEKISLAVDRLLDEIA